MNEKCNFQIKTIKFDKKQNAIRIAVDTHEPFSQK